MPGVRSMNLYLIIEILIRVLLIGLFCYMETVSPFIRVIPPSELAELKYPRTDSYVSSGVLWSIVVTVPLICSLVACIAYDDFTDAFELLLAWSLSVGLTGVLTDLVKVIAGRPRPDFFYRCFPDGVPADNMQCSGELEVVMDGRKSFPSGHSSLSWCSLGMMSVWLCGRLGTAARPRGSALPVLVCLAPLVGAGCVALSRTCDYHHHWQDVLIGSLLGYSVSLMCYKQYYHPLSSDMHGVPYIVTASKQAVKAESPVKDSSSKETSPLLNCRKEDKWI